MGKLFGWILFAIGSWMLVSPQALMGLAQLQWMHAYAFPGEVLLGIVVLALGLHFIGLKPPRKGSGGH